MELRPNVYCPFCGLILLSDSEDELVSQTRERPWIGEIRAIFTTGNNHITPSLTGVGILRTRSILLAPLESELSYKDTSSLVDILLFQTRETHWGYGFHNSCWELFLARLSHTKNLADVLSGIFNLLYITPCPSFSYFDFGHDYGGAAATHKPYGRPFPIDLSSSLYSNPCAIPSLDDLETYCSEIFSSNSPVENVVLDLHTPTSSGLGDLLGKLPPELLYHILSFLPLIEVANLRLVSHHFALIANRKNLPHSFWKTRFRLGGEQAFICPDLSMKRDWYRLFFGTRACLQTKNALLTNRKRIWALLESITALIEREGALQLLGSEISSEADHKWVRRLDTALSDDLPSTFQGIYSLSGKLTSGSHQLTDGCRAQQFRLIGIPRRFSNSGGNIGISIVDIGTRCYISGMKCQFSHDPGAGMSCVGFLVANVESIHIPPGAIIQTVEVAFRTTGLVGIRVCFSGHESSKWIGQNEGKDVARGSLKIPENSETFYMVVGLDEHKIVALNLVQPHNTTLLPSRATMFGGASNFIQSNLWAPEVPVYNGLVFSSLEPPQIISTFEPLINVDFGGLRGMLLPYLTRIVIYMVSDHRPIIGIGFFYTNRSIRFGDTNGVQLSFLINGPEGERISDISITVDDPPDRICSLEISTTYGRHMLFASVHRRSKLSLKQKLHPQLPKGNIITGFIATETQYVNEGSCAKIGLQGQPSEECYYQQPKHTVNHACTLSENQAAHDQQLAFCMRVKGESVYGTYASLRGVRRIQISTRSSKESRLPCDICGLRFDYHDCYDSSTIVGQWMDEGDAMELSQDEEVQSLTIWVRKVEHRWAVNVGQGRVIAIRIDTNRNQSKMFQLESHDHSVNGCMRHHYQSGTHEDLTGLSWLLSYSFDMVRAITSEKRTSGAFQLLLVPSQVSPFDQVQKIFFDSLYDDSLGPLTSITAHYQEEGISGLAFSYKSKKTDMIGYPTDDHQTIQVKEGSRIVRFSVTVSGNNVTELEFLFEFGTEDSSLVSWKNRFTVPLEDNSPNIQATKYGCRKIWCTAERDARDVLRKKVDEKIFEPPSGASMVGIYASCRQFSHIGALFRVPQN